MPTGYRFTRFVISTILVYAAGASAAPPQPATAVLAEHPPLQQLLREEMQALRDGLARLSVALPQGEWETVAQQAKAMHESYILKQSLSPAQRKTLRQSLPAEFIQLDKRFHRYAQRLHRAARDRDAEMSVHFLSRAIETCLACHRRFAPQRFPALQAPAAQGE